MPLKIKDIVNKFSSSPRKLFLVDCFGALLTAFLAGFVLAGFNGLFGMPRHISYDLAFIACMYAVYSFCCYVFLKDNWQVFMKVLAIFNLLYFCFTFEMLSLFYNELTVFGLTYFVLEMLVMSILIIVELSVLFRASRDHWI